MVIEAEHENQEKSQIVEERESLILGILKRDPEVVTKAGIDNALYSIIGQEGRHWRYSRNL